MRDLSAVAKEDSNHWVPIQDLPFDEIILFAYAADHSSRPTYVCLPSGLYHARSGQSCSFFFSLEFGRCRAKARSLHEHKLSKRRLYKDTVGPYTQANLSRTTKKHTRPPKHDDPQIPQPDLCFARENSKTARKTNCNLVDRNFSFLLPSQRTGFHKQICLLFVLQIRSFSLLLSRVPYSLLS